MRGNMVTDDQVAAVVSDRLRQLGNVDVLAPGPSALPSADGDPHHACEQARALGAEYVVLTSADISLLDNTTCLVGTGLLSKIVLPLPIPLPVLRRTEVANVAITLPDRCLISVELGDRWSVVANAQVFSTAQCLATGGQFAIARGTNLTARDGAALQDKITKLTSDLFPTRATVARIDGARGVVVATSGMQAGDVYEVRKGPQADGSLAYVREVDAERAIIEPYAPTDQIHRDDLLLRRGSPQWIEFLAYGAASQISVGNDRHLASGTGGLFRGQLGRYSIGLTAEYLRILDADTRRDTATTSTFKAGLQGGVHHHLSTRVDLYGVLELGYADTLGISLEGDGRAPYAALFAGARLAFDKWFAGLELGGLYSGTQNWDAHASVSQRGVAARLTLGRNFRLGL
ncbi:MAG: hypothetical protein H0X17_00055 [Deltaproteobacteria bacterium]|nr:hypothetical protein [Deltaproteobacteria bacterium]